MVSRLRLGFMVLEFKVFRVYGLKMRIPRFKIYSFREAAAVAATENQCIGGRKRIREGRKEKSKRRREGKEKEEGEVEKEEEAAATQAFRDDFVEDDDNKDLGVKCD
ncbi:hypothetical protein M9H77_27189 [Catharanthus roseus]|uniref:Uncharacterized protein n=1 Tax=Catharanthus roseus TaxID=4058 RepID=A0ACC0AFX2_CATRO|nr:hypothetical protein M9H77_27189 [Catharanthus roseus]